MDLQTLAQVSQILGVTAVIAAVVFGLLQVRQFRVQRRDAAGQNWCVLFRMRSLHRLIRC